jgi:hypothetical protein
VAAACARGNACYEDTAIAAPEIPTTFPPYLVAGATWQWTQKLYDQVTGDEFAADDAGTVKLHLNGKSSLEMSATAQPATDDWLFSLAATGTTPATDNITLDGDYRWRILGTLSGTVYDLGSGVIKVFGYPDTSNGSDNGTFAQKALLLLQAEYLARVGGTAGSGHNRYQIHNRYIEKWTPAEIAIEIARMEGIVARDTRGRPKPIYIGFGRARF